MGGADGLWDDHLREDSVGRKTMREVVIVSATESPIGELEDR